MLRFNGEFSLDLSKKSESERTKESTTTSNVYPEFSHHTTYLLKSTFF